MEITSYLLGKKSSGGGGEPTGKIDTLAKLNEKANELVEYYKTIPRTYTSYTDENITLYTPDETCKTYAIVKTTTDKYRIYWFKDNIGTYLQKIISNGNYNFRVWYLNFTSIPNYDLSAYSNGIVPVLVTPPGYQSSNMSTIDECLSAIQSNETSYTQAGNFIAIKKDTNYEIPFCNTFIIDSELDTQATTQKISSNETIEVISS